jgi:3-dehydroquinate synthase
VEILDVELADRSYPILIGAGLLESGTEIDARVAARDLLIVSNTTVAPLYMAALRRALAGRRILECILPDGEVHKTLSNLSRVLDVLVANRYARDAGVVALGGGVIGDLAGFAAACYQRGVDFIQVPTTLLAQVDSSVGGKTGVNHVGGKNLIGAFHQPKVVFCDVDSLRTLPPRELSAGLAEVVKYALLGDAAFFAWLEDHAEALLAQEPAALTEVIGRCCGMKAGIVRRDEREQGERALLNLGHTFGHAIESTTGYGEWLHGEAVGAGLLMAASMSVRCGWLPASDLARIEALLRRLGLTRDTAGITARDALEHMRIDKKVKAGRLRLVLLRRIGEAFVTADYEDALLHATLAQHFG